MERPQTGFARRRKLLKSSSHLINGMSERPVSPSSTKPRFHQQQMMFHSVKLVKVSETKIERPKTGVPVRKLDSKTGEFFFETHNKEKSRTPQMHASRPKHR